MLQQAIKKIKWKNWTEKCTHNHIWCLGGATHRAVTHSGHRMWGCHKCAPWTCGYSYTAKIKDKILGNGTKY